MSSPQDGEVLAGGNVAAAVVRVGSTVRKPAGAATPAVEALLGHLERTGFDGAPRTLAAYGLDPDQRRHLPALIAAHPRAMFDLLHRSSLTGAQPWARLHAEGHGEHWGPAADYVDRHQDSWVDALLT